MTTRQKVIEIIDRLSEAELQAEYEHLLGATAPALSDAEFETALASLDAIRDSIETPVDAVELVRQGRDELAQRGLWTS